MAFVKFKLITLAAVHFSTAFLGIFLVIFPENACTIVEGFQKGVYFTESNRIWSAIIPAVILGYVLASGVSTDIKNCKRTNGSLNISDYIEPKSSLTNPLFKYLGSRPRLYIAYPTLLFVILYLGGGIIRCVAI